MAPRSSWKGFIRLSLVSVPVKAYTANQTGAEVRLNQLHAGCHNRVRYVKTCPEHGELSSDDIVSGYEYAKNQYVVIDTDELQKIRKQSDKSVQISGFVPGDAVEPRYWAGRTYYLVPDGAVGQKPYQLLHRAMVDEHVHAIAQVVIAGREQLVLLRPVDKLIAMSVLHHEAKVKAPESFEDELSEQKLPDAELSLTKTLLEASRIEDFDLADFKDDYVENLTKLIEAKVEGQEIVQAPEAEEPKILDLMEALKRSVAQAQGAPAEEEPAAGKAKKSRKKMAPSARSKAAARKKKSG